MMVCSSGVAFVLAKIPMLRGMRVAAETQRIGMSRNRFQKGLGIDSRDAGIGARQCLKRNVEKEDHQSVPRHVAQHIADKGELLVTKVASIFAIAIGLRRIRSEVLNIVEREERRFSHLKCHVPRTEYADVGIA